MEDCQECGGLISEGNECEYCHTTVEVSLFISVIKVMSEKVKVYKDVMQERLQIIREDIISSITEETMKYQKILDSSLETLNNYMTELSEINIKEGETKTIVSPEVILDSLGIKNINFNMNAQEIHGAFLFAMRGNFVLFRAIFRNSR